MRAVVAVDDRGPRVVAHAARAQEVGRERRLLHRLAPGAPRARGLENLDRPVLQEAHHRQVVRVVPVSDPHGRQPPRVLHLGIERDAVGLERQRRGVTVHVHGARVIIPQDALVSRAPRGRVVRQAPQGEDRRVGEGARVGRPAAVEAPLGVALIEVVQHPRRRHALELVQRALEHAARARVAVEHQVLAHDAARVRQAAREAARRRQEEQPRRLRAVAAQHDGPGALELLLLVLVEVRRAGHPALLVDLDPPHVAVGSHLASPGRFGHRDDGVQCGRLGAELAAEAETVAAVLARRPAVKRLGENGEGRGLRVQAQGARAALEQDARRFHRERRQGIGARARRVERPGLAGDAQLPLGLGVVGLEVAVGDRPVFEARAGDRAEAAFLDEVDLAEAPVVGGEHDAPAAYEAVVEELYLPRLCRLGLAPAEREPGRVDLEGALEQRLDLVVLELRRLDAGSLFEHDHREAGGRELLGDDPARRAGANHHEVHRAAGVEAGRRACGSHRYRPPRAASAS